MTTVVNIAFEDGALEEYAHQNPKGGRIIKFAGLDQGTTGGNPSIAIAIETQDGEIVIAETTWRLLSAAHAAFTGRWGEAK